MTSLLSGKTAVIYGAGPVGRGVTQTFVREGATVHLASRSQGGLDAAVSQTPQVQTAIVDVLDEAAVVEHLAKVGPVDIAFILVSRGDVQGIPFLELATDDLLAPVVNGLRATFNTARAAARVMAEQGSGAILTLTSASSAGLAPAMGGTGPADAAVEALLRYLAAEVGPRGVRVLGLWAAGIPESFPEQPDAGRGGIDRAAIDQMMSGMAALGRATHLEEFAETAAFLASDHARAITGTMVNVTSGLIIR